MSSCLTRSRKNLSVIGQKVQRPNPFALDRGSPWQEGQTFVVGSVLLSKTVPVSHNRAGQLLAFLLVARSAKEWESLYPCSTLVMTRKPDGFTVSSSWVR